MMNDDDDRMVLIGVQLCCVTPGLVKAGTSVKICDVYRESRALRPIDSKSRALRPFTAFILRIGDPELDAQ